MVSRWPWLYVRDILDQPRNPHMEGSSSSDESRPYAIIQALLGAPRYRCLSSKRFLIYPPPTVALPTINVSASNTVFMGALDMDQLHKPDLMQTYIRMHSGSLIGVRVISAKGKFT